MQVVEGFITLLYEYSGLIKSLYAFVAPVVWEFNQVLKIVQFYLRIFGTFFNNIFLSLLLNYLLFFFFFVFDRVFKVSLLVRKGPSFSNFLFLYIHCYSLFFWFFYQTHLVGFISSYVPHIYQSPNLKYS